MVIKGDKWGVVLHACHVVTRKARAQNWPKITRLRKDHLFSSPRSSKNNMKLDAEK